MDAHYHKVMKAIDEVKETGTRLYFAYSGVLDRQAFEEWRTQHSYEFFNLPEGEVAEAVDQDLVFDFPSRWWGGRVAGLTPKAGSSVFGRLYEISAKNWPVVQHKEGVITGMSIEKKIPVKVAGKIVEAIAFTTSPDRAQLQGPVSERYVASLVAGATKAGLPQSYVESLTSKAR